jgi:hypothetical protein
MSAPPRRRPGEGSEAMRGFVAAALALTMACYALPAAGQQPDAKPRPSAAPEGTSKMRSVTGSVKTATDKGLVVVGREAGQKDKEWAFALDPTTRIEAGGTMKAAADLREGDAVTVTYTNRDGKIVAQNVTVKGP